MHLSPTEYGIWFISHSIAYMIVNWLTGRFSRRIGSARMIWTGYYLALFGLAIMAWLAGIAALGPAVMFLLMGFVSAGNGLSTANSISGAISADPAQADAASGMTGFLQMIMGAFRGILISFALEASKLPFTLTLGMLASALMAIYLFAAAEASGSRSGRPSHSQ